MKDLKLTRKHLERAGLQELGYPYSNFERVVMTALLPPLLEWGEDGPYLDVGGIEMDVIISMAVDCRAWSAARIPVALVHDEGQLHLVPDASRPAEIQEIGFNRLPTFADHQEVYNLMRVAVPTAVKEVFGTLPAIVIPQTHIPRLSGAAGPLLTLSPKTISTRPDRWQIELDMTRTR